MWAGIIRYYILFLTSSNSLLCPRPNDEADPVKKDWVNTASSAAALSSNLPPKSRDVCGKDETGWCQYVIYKIK